MLLSDAHVRFRQKLVAIDHMVKRTVAFTYLSRFHSFTEPSAELDAIQHADASSDLVASGWNAIQPTLLL